MTEAEQQILEELREIKELLREILNSFEGWKKEPLVWTTSAGF